MKLSRPHKKPAGDRHAGVVVSVPSDQGVVHVPASALPVLPTKPTKAYVAALITLAGLVGIHLTTGTAQALVMAGQLVLVAYGVWRTRNQLHGAKRRKARGVGDFL